MKELIENPYIEILKFIDKNEFTYSEWKKLNDLVSEYFEAKKNSMKFEINDSILSLASDTYHGWSRKKDKVVNIEKDYDTKVIKKVTCPHCGETSNIDFYPPYKTKSKFCPKCGQMNLVDFYKVCKELI